MGSDAACAGRLRIQRGHSIRWKHSHGSITGFTLEWNRHVCEFFGYDAKPGAGLTLSKSGGMTYVKALYLGDLGVELSFVTPKVSKLAKLAKSQTATSASASGAH
jgi:hypothetical protein